MDISSLKQQAHHLRPAVRIGKAGLSQGIVQEIDVQLKKNKLVKVKMLPAFVDLYDARQTAQTVADKLNATIIQQSGNTVVVYRERNKRE